MRKFIHANTEQKERLRKIFRCSDRTIRNALAYDPAKGDTELCRKIRFTALQDGCHTYIVVDQLMCFYDSNGVMHNLCPNGAEVELDKNTGKGVIIFKGREVATFENVMLSQISAIQEQALALR